MGPPDASNPAAVGISRPERRARTVGIGAETGPLLDLERALMQVASEPSAPAASRQRGPSLGLLLSLALHLLPLLLLVEWKSAPVEAPMPIPVQLVLEQPPPPPPPVPVARPEPVVKPPPPGRLASEEIGERAERPGDDPVPAPAAAPPDAEPGQPAEAESTPEPRQATQAESTPERRQAAKAEREPELQQVANLVSSKREPTLLDRQALALPAPDFEPLPERPAAPVASRQPTPPRRPPQRAAAVEGPPAVQDAYLANLVTLVRPHLRLLPPEIINGRQGTTSLAIRVLGDGTIARIAVSQSSGHPDIDAKVIQIVASVGRFPPLPPWIDQPSWDINFHLRFPFPQGGSGR